jgi:hypothetical protein
MSTEQHAAVPMPAAPIASLKHEQTIALGARKIFDVRQFSRVL